MPAQSHYTTPSLYSSSSPALWVASSATKTPVLRPSAIQSTLEITHAALWCVIIEKWTGASPWTPFLYQAFIKYHYNGLSSLLRSLHAQVVILQKIVVIGTYLKQHKKQTCIIKDLVQFHLHDWSLHFLKNK